ncbi:unnamed protein product [Cyprideis torosa]|uniref:Uncharacterized protein n=1 Tax=Cyprideis torosa TaxID=163714 RepID=A0A7R8W4C6_9CRUS|nr:unnamed protein product [Cyprideis torosa]CAG0880489.1 unnamed protein product [Cyprideis torosa]
MFVGDISFYLKNNNPGPADYLPSSSSTVRFGASAKTVKTKAVVNAREEGDDGSSAVLPRGQTVVAEIQTSPSFASAPSERPPCSASGTQTTPPSSRQPDVQTMTSPPRGQTVVAEIQTSPSFASAPSERPPCSASKAEMGTQTTPVSEKTQATPPSKEREQATPIQKQEAETTLTPSSRQPDVQPGRFLNQSALSSPLASTPKEVLRARVQDVKQDLASKEELLQFRETELTVTVEDEEEKGDELFRREQQLVLREEEIMTQEEELKKQTQKAKEELEKEREEVEKRRKQVETRETESQPKRKRSEGAEETREGGRARPTKRRRVEDEEVSELTIDQCLLNGVNKDLFMKRATN